MSVIILKCSDPDFKVTWNFTSQSYTVYYKTQYLTTAYRYDDIKSYLK